MAYPRQVPSSEPDSAFRYGEGEPQEVVTDAPWDFTSFFTPAAELGHNGNLVANPNLDLAVNPPTCRSQAVRGTPLVRPGFDLNSMPFPGAHPQWSAQVAAARHYYAPNVPSRSADRSRRPSLSTPVSSPTDMFHSAGPVSAADWASFSTGSEVPVNIGSLPTFGLPQSSFNPVLPLSTEYFAQLMAPAAPSLSQLSDANSSYPLPSSNLRDAFDSFNTIPNDRALVSPNEGNNPPWPNAVVHNTVDRDYYGRCSPTVSIDVAGSHPTVPDPSPPKKRPSTRQPKAPSTPLAIVQYEPPNSKGAKSSKKRSAPEEITPQGMASQTLREVPVLDDSGEVKGTMMTFGNRFKSRAVFTEEKRLQTALARRKGVCPRCKKSKRQCDLAQKESPYVSCTLCTEHKIYKNAPRLPCFGTTLADILFFRSGPAPNEPFFTKRLAVLHDLGDLSKPDVSARMLKLTQRIGSHQLTVYASEFVPSPGDVVSYKWTDRSGKLHELNMPPYCLTNVEKIRRHICQYIASAKWAYLASVKTEDKLAWMTISVAMEFAQRNPKSLVADSLDLWAISRMIEIPWEMCGPDTLGVSPVRDATSPHKGRIPIPPIMDTHLDQIVIKSILTPLRERLVEKFERLITPVKREAWWEIYLSAFILLNHIERLARHSVAHAKTHTMPGKYSNIQFLEAAFHTAKSILARFHFLCNGSVPLKMDWTSPSLAAMAKLEPKQVEFMQTTQAMIMARESDVLSLRKTHKYEKTLYWAGQLFTENFDTSPVHVVEELDENDTDAAEEESQLAVKCEE
ncbi:uncharacterized protein B0H64DRAFT_400950 [Chaetomium fimeti]|uniref:Zn(2)-C6 fungal-type domain-containing protein n=1 Tax=Chaetomium fimeti TaxID=1854472 RepID=A0AAE0HDI6_9PEZI|nr:hypothetical protein B0H64DRAFT_400950 [Chaetomium fimeti]